MLSSDDAVNPNNAKRLDCSDGSAIVNGVYLPLIVTSQLKALGRPLESYSPGELDNAIKAVQVDGNLIDDPLGKNFEDQLTLTDSEKSERAEKSNPYLVDVGCNALFTEIKALSHGENSSHSQQISDDHNVPHSPLANNDF